MEKETFGTLLVNPNQDSGKITTVDIIKDYFVKIIDLVDSASVDDTYVAGCIKEAAISYLITAQMWAVKSVTNTN